MNRGRPDKTAKTLDQITMQRGAERRGGGELRPASNRPGAEPALQKRSRDGQRISQAESHFACPAISTKSKKEGNRSSNEAGNFRGGTRGCSAGKSPHPRK